ncbi:MAG: hypothetical protein WCI74_20685, partial [Actinomycetes bacterium]
MEPVNDADGWLRSQAETQVEHQSVPSARSDPADPTWATPIGRRAHRIIAVGKWLNRLASIILIGTAIATILNVDTDEGVAGELLSASGFMLCLLISVSIELNTRRGNTAIVFGRAVAGIALVLSLAAMPFATGRPTFVQLGSTDLLVGPSSQRFLIAVALIALALVIPADSRHRERVVPLCVVTGAGLGLLEVISYWYGTG